MQGAGERPRGEEPGDALDEHLKTIGACGAVLDEMAPTCMSFFGYFLMRYLHGIGEQCFGEMSSFVNVPVLNATDPFVSSELQ
jgi:hypothetical protein